jgi:hypothetical protein
MSILPTAIACDGPYCSMTAEAQSVRVRGMQYEEIAPERWGTGQQFHLCPGCIDDGVRAMRRIPFLLAQVDRRPA